MRRRAGLMVVLGEYRRTRLVGFLAPLVMMGLLAALGGLFMGGLAASILNDGLVPDEPD